MSDNNTLVANLVRDLHNGGRLRVWSIIVTVFGDAVMPRGGIISLSSLQDILGLLEIEENAVRTAMSRLAGDGWVQRHREGRLSFYSLDAAGRELFESASARIYAAGPNAWDETFELVLRNEQSHKTRAGFRREMRQLGYGSPIPDLYIRPNTTGTEKNSPVDALAVMEARNLISGSVREFVARTWPMEELNQKYRSLSEKFSPVLDAANNGNSFEPAAALAIRILLVHEWRRVVLQDVDLPLNLKPEPWYGEDARQMAGTLYRVLSVPSETYLDDCLAGRGKTLPPANAMFSKRFPA